jgi:radical SAM superfamily enzyme YgiQ (UPF0313 family)
MAKKSFDRGAAGRKRFTLVLIKPSHYDDDGYVIQWARSVIPANSLASVYGLARDSAARRILGDDVELDIHAWDETNRRIRPDRVARLVDSGDGGLVMLIGVQSNQFPRSLDLAQALIDRGLKVAIGGFHVSGVISMLDGVDRDLDRARAMGVTLFAGEAEGRLDEVIRDGHAGTLKPMYNHMNDLPGIEGVPIPFLPAHVVHRTVSKSTSFDAGRGCPYQCSFCTIINVQGRKSRRRSPDDVEAIVRANAAQGLRDFFITDDNFARNKDWEPILDRLIHLRRVEKIPFVLTIQVDTLCHKIPNFIEKCARASVRTAFIGLENINPANLIEAKKRQNKITEYRKLILAFKKAGVLTIAGYITGFPNDTVESILHDVEVVKRELPLDLLEFFYLTPLPGSEDHQKLHRAGIAMDPDLNKYDLHHRTTAHARMSGEEWDKAYRAAWASYYSWEHVETVFRRIAAARVGTPRVKLAQAVVNVAWFKGGIEIEDVHPLETGLFRIKDRLSRRPERGIEPAWRFYPWRIADVARNQARWAMLAGGIVRRLVRVLRDPARYDYTDAAVAPIGDDEIATHELFQSDAARSFVDHQRRVKEMQASGHDAEREPQALAG